MASVEQHLSKLREERIAREKARIEKLRELNLKKYGKTEQPTLKPAVSNASVNRSVKSETTAKNNVSNTVKNNNVNGTFKRPISVPIPIRKTVLNKDLTDTKCTKTIVHNVKMDKTVNKVDKPTAQTKVDINSKPTKIPINREKIIEKTSNESAKTSDRIVTKTKVEKTIVRKSLYMGTTTKTGLGPVKSLQSKEVTRTKPLESLRKSIQPPKVTQSASKVNPNRQSVFERLYQPKIVPKKPVDEVKKLQTDPNFFKKVMKNAELLLNKRHTVFDIQKPTLKPVRRSISAVHLKKVSRNEMTNCFHKWSSIGEKLDKIHLKEINEDDTVNEDKVISAVKSERKKVKFQSPAPFNFNTPKPQELQSRLQNWLQKRGKSIDSYQHLQCFGIHHLSRNIKPLVLEETEKCDEFDEENKENVPLESDSDNESYEDNMNNRSKDGKDLKDQDEGKDKWRRRSYVSESLDFNETQQSALTTDTDVDDLLLGALNDLTELLREGFDWDQCARWLRAIRERFPSAPDSAAYWECRAALEEGRGDLPTSIQCWEEAIAKGTERSIVEANLDQLLDKFMQLKISPNSNKRQPDPKLIDVKNIFKSTIIRFAVQQAKLRNQSNPTPTKYTCTPVRRSGRLSARFSDKRTPLLVCTSVKQAHLLGHPVLFVPNDKLCGTP